MPEPLRSDWSTQQLAEFLAAVSDAAEPAAVLQRGVERAAEAFEAEVAFVEVDAELAAVVGYPAGRVPAEELLALAPDGIVELPSMGTAQAMTAAIDEPMGRIVVARVGEEAFDVAESNLLRGMARVLHLTVTMLERQRLLEKLSVIQRSISHRAPLQEVLDAITAGARELLSCEIAALRVLDPDDPTHMLMVSSAGIAPDVVEKVRRTAVREGVGGQAIVEDRFVMLADYQDSPRAIKAFAAEDLQTAMAAPVREDGVAVGSLIVGSLRPTRVFSGSEQRALTALAEHASVALTDAKTVEAMREAERSRDMFLAMVSHELKTPLTVIMGAIKTLESRGERLPAEVRSELIDAAYDRGRELERLIDKLLRGARAELAGEREVVFLPRLVRAAVQGFERARRIRVDGVPDINVRLDRAAAMQVIGALLENAVSHAPAGSEIVIRARAGDAELVIEVENEGDLPEDISPTDLFAPFRRSADARSPGVGLGLYIASRVAESMLGRLSVDSDDGRVVFGLHLRRDEVEAASDAAARSAS